LKKCLTYLKKDISKIGSFHIDALNTIMRTLPDLFIDIFQKYPTSLMFIPKEEIMPKYEKYIDLFIKAFESKPQIIEYFPEEQKMNILNKHINIFAKAFEKYPRLIRYFPKEQRLNIVSTFPIIFKKYKNDSPRTFNDLFTEKDLTEVNKIIQ